MNLKIVDLPIRYRERTYGTTKHFAGKHGWLLLRMAVFGADGSGSFSSRSERKRQNEQPANNKYGIASDDQTERTEMGQYLKYLVGAGHLDALEQDN